VIDGPPSLQKIMETLGIPSGSTRDVSSLLPFSLGDVTAGTETELQAAVVGKRCDVDLPLTIEQSNYYQNIVRRALQRDLLTDKSDRAGGQRSDVHKFFWRQDGEESLRIPVEKRRDE